MPGFQDRETRRRRYRPERAAPNETMKPPNLPQAKKTEYDQHNNHGTYKPNDTIHD